jgi:hypothetical protein
MPAWRKKMIHYIKDENPEINTAIIEAANKTDLFADVNTASFLDKLDPTLVNKSFEEIVKAIERETKKVNSAYQKAEANFK